MKIKYGLTPIIRIKELLEEKHLTQKELAEMMGETPQQINKWVMGVEPCLSALGRISLTLGVKLGDLVWLKGDDASFNLHSVIYIRGEIFNNLQSESELLDVLKEYYRLTDAELGGIKVISCHIKKSEAMLGCVSEKRSKEFIAWAKKDREYMYRL